MSEQPLTMSVGEFSKLIGISRSSVYDLVALGVIKGVRVGRRVLVLRSEVDRFLRASRTH